MSLPAAPQTTTKNSIIIDRLLTLLREQYLPYVKDAILWLEVHTGERSKRAVHELRDALDHIAIAVQTDIKEEEALKSLDAVEEHFRRAAVEPAEWVALEQLRKLLKIKQNGFWWWKLFFLKPPDSKDFNDKIYKGQEFIAQGRHFKGISLSESYKNFKEGYIVFRKLLDEVQPAELNSRIFAVVLVAIGLIAGGLITWVVSAYFYALQLHSVAPLIK